MRNLFCPSIPSSSAALQGQRRSSPLKMPSLLETPLVPTSAPPWSMVLIAPWCSRGVRPRNSLRLRHWSRPSFSTPLPRSTSITRRGSFILDTKRWNSPPSNFEVGDLRRRWRGLGLRWLTVVAIRILRITFWKAVVFANYVCHFCQMLLVKQSFFMFFFEVSAHLLFNFWVRRGMGAKWLIYCSNFEVRCFRIEYTSNFELEHLANYVRLYHYSRGILLLTVFFNLRMPSAWSNNVVYVFEFRSSNWWLELINDFFRI